MKMSEMTRRILIAKLDTTSLRMSVAFMRPSLYCAWATEKVLAEAMVRATVTKNAAAFCNQGLEPEDNTDVPLGIILVNPLPASHPVPLLGAFDEYRPGARNKRVSKNHAMTVVVATT